MHIEMFQRYFSESLNVKNWEELKMARPRKQTYTLDMYLNKNRDGDISNDADTQRKPAWKAIVNGLIVTTLTDDYIPPIILAEEENTQLHIADGGSRTAALMMFRHGNYKITSSIEDSMIPYKKKIIDENGNIGWEDADFNIKGKTYDQLPDELKKKFNEYQIETVIHEHCDKNKIAKYIKRYNNHSAMNTNQKAFTYIDKFANRIRKIMDSSFFLNCTAYSDNDKNKGVVERIIVETMMCMNHFDNWKTQAKSAFKYMNEHAAEEEFDAFEDNLHRIEDVMTADMKDIFNKKDSFIFLTLFDKFAKLDVDDKRFAEFLREFRDNDRSNKRNQKGLLFDEIDKDGSTKDKQVIADKLNMLETLMFEFLHIKKAKNKIGNPELFIAEILDMDISDVNNDMEFYSESLDDLTSRTVKDGSRLLHEENRLSLLAMVAYSYKEDVDLEKWLFGYAQNNQTYLADQRKNFIYMKKDFERFIKHGRG